VKKFVFGVMCLLLCAGCAQKTDPNTVRIWHWMTDRQRAFEQLAEKYEQQTGIKIKFDLYAPSDIYSQKVQAAAQARVLPDIFGVLQKKKVFASFIEGGFVADLTDEFRKDNSAWENSIFPKALASNRFERDNVFNIKPGIYGVPIDVTNIQMLYNRKLLAKAGIESVPKTFDEFLEAAETLKRVGISGFVSGWGETWMIDCFASNYAFNIMGERKIMSTYSGETPYTDSDWIEVLQIFATLRDKGALVDGVVTKANKYAEQDFALERAAFTFNGSWCVNVYHDMNAKLDYGVMMPPAINPKLPMRIWGGAGSSFVVNNISKKKQKAIDFLKWLTEKEQQAFLSEETKNLPSNKEALSEISQVLSGFGEAMDFTTHPTVWKYNEHPMVTEAFDKGIQAIIIGEKTPQQVAEEVQRVKLREMKKEQLRR